MVARVRGIRVAYDAKRAAAGKGWGVFVDVRLNGQRYAPTKFFTTEAEAEVCYAAAATELATLREEAEREARVQKALAVPPLPPAPTGAVLFETIALRWLTEHVLEMNEPATYRGYHDKLAHHLLPIMRTWPVTDDVMTPQRVKDVLKTQLQAKGVTLGTRVACQRLLSALFNWAKAELPPRQLTTNPAEKLGRYLRDKTEKGVRLKQPPNPMTRVQAEAFLTWQAEHTPELYEYFLWLIDEGSRIGEVSALKWPKVDLDHGKAHIVEAFSSSTRWMERKQEQAQGKVPSLPEPTSGEKGTKTHRENQYIDLSGRVVEALRALRARNLQAWLARGRPGKEPQHVYLTSKLTPRRPDKIVRRAFREACDARRLVGQTGKPFTIHCLRDTFATLAILEGKPIGWVSMMLGHADEQTTRDHYYKWVRLVDDNPLARKGE
jgi:integrase